MTEIQGKSILVRVSGRFELARVRVIGSQLYQFTEVPVIVWGQKHILIVLIAPVGIKCHMNKRDDVRVISSRGFSWFPTFGRALCCQHFLCFILRNQTIQITVVHVSKACGSRILVNPGIVPFFLLTSDVD